MIELPKPLEHAIQKLLDNGTDSQTIIDILHSYIYKPIQNQPEQKKTNSEKLIQVGKIMRKNRSLARALTENGNGKDESILKKIKLNIELLNDRLLNLQTEKEGNFTMQEAATFSRALRAVSEAAKNDQAMHRKIEEELKRKQSLKLVKAQKKGSIDPIAVQTAMQILGLC